VKLDMKAEKTESLERRLEQLGQIQYKINLMKGTTERVIRLPTTVIATTRAPSER